MDPNVSQQALQAGVSKKSLDEMMKILGRDGTAAAAPPPPTPSPHSSSEDEATAGGDGSGSQDSLAKAVVSLSKIVGQMHKEKTIRRDKGLEDILDRAESVSAKEPGVSMRSKASLQSLLHKEPRLIYEALERHLQEDWELAQAQPGITSSPVSARGWIEHRSTISIEHKKCMASWRNRGLLRQGRNEEARARAALGVAIMDQQSCDAGQWLLANELSLEPAPPYGSFASHSAPSSWETPHTHLIDGRWFELIMSRLRGLAEFQEKKGKLTAAKKDKEKEKDDLLKPKAKPKAKGGGKNQQTEGLTPPAAQ